MRDGEHHHVLVEYEWNPTTGVGVFTYEDTIGDHPAPLVVTRPQPGGPWHKESWAMTRAERLERSNRDRDRLWPAIVDARAQSARKIQP